MTNREYYLKTLKTELPIFMRVFKAVETTPKDKHSLRHDPKGKSAFELVTQTFAVEGSSFVEISKTGKVDFSLLFKKPMPKSVKDGSKIFEKKMKETVQIISKMKDEKWEKGKAQMLTSKKVEWETSMMDMMWGLLFDLIHHRGQLSTFIRPMGGKVPSIYGPSADTK